MYPYWYYSILNCVGLGVDMQKEEIIKDIIGIDIKVLTYSGHVKVIHFDDLNCDGLISTLSIEHDCEPLSLRPPCKRLMLDVECYDYNMRIDQVEANG